MQQEQGAAGAGGQLGVSECLVNKGGLGVSPFCPPLLLLLISGGGPIELVIEESILSIEAEEEDDHLAM